VTEVRRRFGRRDSVWLAIAGLLVCSACTSSPTQPPSAEQSGRTAPSAEPSTTASLTPSPTAGTTAAPLPVEFTYQGEHHAFGPQWPTSMRRTVAFFDRQLRT
jgi:hypothetical protein